MRDQDEDRAGGRFLEPLQQRVGGVRIEILGRVHQRDAQGAAMRAQVEEAGQPADLVDGDVEARLFRAPGRGLAPLLLFRRRRQLGDRLGLKASEIRMTAGNEPAATVAAAARALRAVGVLAKEELRHLLGERELADAARAMNQERVRQALALFQRLQDRLVPGMHQRLASTDWSCLRTAPASTDASMTRMRCGSDFAIAK